MVTCQEDTPTRVTGHSIGHYHCDHGLGPGPLDTGHSDQCYDPGECKHDCCGVVSLASMCVMCCHICVMSQLTQLASVDAHFFKLVPDDNIKISCLCCQLSNFSSNC